MPVLYIAHAKLRTFGLICCLATLLSCASPTPEAPLAPVETAGFGTQNDAIQNALDLARSSSPSESAAYRLEAVTLMLEAGNVEDAQDTLEQITNVSNLPPQTQVLYAVAVANLALAQEEPDVALRALRSSTLTPINAQAPDLQITLRELRAEGYFQDEQYIAAVRERIQLTPLLDSAAINANNNIIWEILASAPRAELSNADVNIDSYELRGWLELARLVESNQRDFQSQISAIDQWRNTWTQHSASAALPAAIARIYTIWENRPQEIALVLPVQEPVGKAISEGFLSAYYEALANGRNVPRVRIYDTSFQSEPLVLYDQAVDDGAQLIIGPILKDAVRRIQRSSRPMPVPTLALNYGDSGLVAPLGLYQFGLAPEDEIMQAADTAWAAGHRYATVLTPNGGDYQRIQDSFVNYWQELGGTIVSVDSYGDARDYSPVIKRLFSIDASEARAARIRNLIPRQNVEFVPRRRQDVDFIFLLANPNEGRQIKPTLAFHFADDVPVYAMPSIYDGGTNPTANRDLNNVIFNDAPWILDNDDPLKPSVTSTWSAASGPIQRLRAMGVDAYRLYLRMELMREFPYTRLNGATGELHYETDGSIHRRLRNAVFVNGVANILTE
ncbi:MAG: penicillin-binding protein activator [Gammaproteobacteria bacterium]